MMLFFRIVANLASALIYAFIIAYLTKVNIDLARFILK